MQHIRTVPILRSFDEGKASELYVGFVGVNVDWEHRFEPGVPLYMRVSRDGIVLHLSEYHGDAPPGSDVRVEINGLRDFPAELICEDVQEQPPGPRAPRMGWARNDGCRSLLEPDHFLGAGGVTSLAGTGGNTIRPGCGREEASADGNKSRRPPVTTGRGGTA